METSKQGNGHVDVAETWVGVWDGQTLTGPPPPVASAMVNLVREHLAHIKRGSTVVVTIRMEAVSD